METISKLKWNWAGHVAITVGQSALYVLDAPWTHKEPRKTKDQMEGRLR